MVWLVIASVIILFIFWMLLAPLELVIDSRVPIAVLQIRSIGRVCIVFEHDVFMLRTRIFFLQFNWKMEERPIRNHQKHVSRKRRTKINPERVLKGLWRMINSFRVNEFELALSPGDYTVAGKLYPLNFVPDSISKNVSIKFYGESYLLLRVATNSWRIVLAWIKK